MNTISKILITGLLAAAIFTNCKGDTSTADLLNGKFINVQADTTPPNILSPQDGATIGLTAVLQWTAKSGAATYTIDVATDSAFANPITGSPFTINAPSTSYTLDLTAMGGNTYYWRVRADTTASGQYGQSSFNALDNILYVYCPAATVDCVAANSGRVGTKSNPYTSISYALARAVVLSVPEVRVAARDATGTPYNEAITIKDGVSMFGGYNSSFTTRDVAANPTIVNGAGSTVVYARDIFQTTVIDGIKFVNTASGFAATFGVKTDNCTSALLFHNVHINGGNGNIASGMNNVNFSMPRIVQSTITTGNGMTIQTSIGVLNQDGSMPDIQNSTITTAGVSASQTYGIQNNAAGVTLINSIVTASNSQNISYGIYGGSIAINNSNITSGSAFSVGGVSQGISAEQGNITSSAIALGDAISQTGISLCNSTGAVLVNITNNAITGKIILCNNTINDSLTVTNNTIYFHGSETGIELKNAVTSANILNISSNIIENNNSFFTSTGIKSGKTIFNNLDKNLLHTLNLLNYNDIWSTQTCSALVTSGSGTFDYTNAIINKTIASGIGSNYIASVFVSGSNIYTGTTGGLTISNNNGLTFLNKTVDNTGSCSIAGNTTLASCTAAGGTWTYGLGANYVSGVFASGTNIYAATFYRGLSISTDGGTTFINKTVDNTGSCSIAGNATLASCTTAGGAWTYGIRNNGLSGVYVIPGASQATDKIYLAANQGISISLDGGATFTSPAIPVIAGSPLGIFVSGNSIYAGTSGGLLISTDGGATWVNKTISNGLVNNWVNGIYVIPGTSQGTDRIFVATRGGLSISTDGGLSFTNKTTANGLASNWLYGIFASGANIYVATSAGLSISTDGGITFINKTTLNGLADNGVLSVFNSGKNIVYAGTAGGLSILTLTDIASTFVNKTTSNNLGSNYVNSVFTSDKNIYVGTIGAGGFLGGLSISTDGGLTFSNKTTANGLGNNSVRGVFASGSNVYAATGGGLSISNDGGVTFINKTTANGLASNLLYGVYTSNSNIYVWSDNGLSISTNGGLTFSNKTTTDGLGSLVVYDVFVSGQNIYAGTTGGLSISTNGGRTFSNKTTANGLGDNVVIGIFASGCNIYAATKGGLSISNDGGLSFQTKTTANGLGSNFVRDVFVLGSYVYVATESGLSISTDGGLSFSNKTTMNGLGGDLVIGLFISGTNVYAATSPSGTASGGLSISASDLPACSSIFSETTGAVTPIGNVRYNLTAGAAGSGAAFDSTVYNPADPKTWVILTGGPADLDYSLANPLTWGWTIGDAGANAANAGYTGTPGATW
ncbi:MAG: hypothetical protein OEV78_11830 [Spirochaetia bacterium]|nr:hypothetical protein [Spirochaetia bacterium]